jgi:hypothetical protein
MLNTDKANAYRVENELCSIPYPQFGENRGEVVAHGTVADPQGARYRASILPLGQVPDDLYLPRGKPPWRLAARRSVVVVFGVFHDVLQGAFGQPRPQVQASCRDAFYRAENIQRLVVFQQVTIGSCLQGPRT